MLLFPLSFDGERRKSFAIIFKLHSSYLVGVNVREEIKLALALVFGK